MEIEINYSFIIPHRNVPHLLQRCIDSIPKRDDIQIIIVDDNSDPKIVNFECFPGLNEKCVEVYFTKEGKGAGYARNIGLTYAKGKWFLFPDADDHYTTDLMNVLDKYVNSNYDIILPSAIHLPATLFYKFKGLTDEDRVIFFKVMEEFYPEYYETAVDYIMNGNKDYAFNMFFCSWKIFSQMMEFVFGFLSCTEKYVKLQPYTNGRRIFGYFSEYLIPIFCLKHRLRIKEMPIISMLQSEKPNYLVRKKNVFKRIINSFRAFIFSPLKYKRFPIAETMLRSLICDGILDHDGRLIK